MQCDLPIYALMIALMISFTPGSCRIQVFRVRPLRVMPYIMRSIKSVRQKKISICFIRGGMESLGNVDVSIVHARE